MMNDQEDMYEIEDNTEYLEHLNYNSNNQISINQFNQNLSDEEIVNEPPKTNSMNRIGVGNSDNINQSKGSKITSNKEQKNENNSQSNRNNQSNIKSSKKSGSVVNGNPQLDASLNRSGNKAAKKPKGVKNSMNQSAVRKGMKDMTVNSSVNNTKVTPSFNRIASNERVLAKEKKVSNSKEKTKNALEKTFCSYDPATSREYDCELITKGERIYMKNLAEKNLKNILEEKERKKNLIKSSESASFAPSLHLTAYYIPQNYQNANHLSETTSYKNKVNFADDTNQEKDEMNLEEEIEVLKKQRIVMTPEKLENHINRLYKESEVLKVNKEKLKEEYYNEICPLKPEINPISGGPQSGTFFSRMQDWLSKKKEKLEDTRKKAQFDGSSQKPLFSPDLSMTANRSMIKSRPQSPEDLLKKLHNDASNTLKKREMLQNEKLMEIRKESEKTITSPQSKEFNEKNKAELFTKIFEILDYNQDKKISYDEDFDQAMKEVPSHIVEILQPLFEEFRENKEILTIKEFVLSCGRLYNILEYYERSQLFQYIFYVKKQQSSRTAKKNKEIEEETQQLSYKPEINTHCKKVFDTSEKYSGTTFLERNSKYLENRKVTEKEGIEKVISQEKIGNLLSLILLKNAPLNLKLIGEDSSRTFQRFLK